MSNDLERAFAALSRDAERARLAPAAELRRRAGRRTAVRSAAALVAVAVLATGATAGARFALAGEDHRRPDHPADRVPAPSASSAPSTTPVSARPPSGTPRSSRTLNIPADVPDWAMLKYADGNTDEFYRFEDGKPPPKPCSAASYPSEKRVLVRATVRLLYRAPELGPEYTPSDEVRNTVTAYRATGAEEFLDELRAAVRSCPEGKLGSAPAAFRSLGSMGLGDESLLVERSTEGYNDDGTPSGNRRRTYIAAVRVNDAVTLLETYGYESVPSDRSVVESLTRAAADRLTTWRG
ncbi:hypothetical protein [Actinoplanes aureus]|uniref:Uncharacterized protein n=1 Tax=Actinoplanes aureus TaxID=2792083 RepID=A0A931FWZ7_9ACTN|nr:hypothetical protein [Actinoplanes aureus]MBG0562978.1 hypothetical protein [Actinoplanes aureus]